MAGRKIACVIVMMACGMAGAQTTQPAAPRVSATRAAATNRAPAVPADYSSPKKAVASFLQATDEKSLRDALVIAPESRASVEAFVGVMVSTIALQKEAEAQFGSAAAQYFSKATDAQLQRRLKVVNDAELTMNGTDAASINLPPDEEARQSGGTIELKKIDGQWKIDAASMFGLAKTPPETTAKRVRMAETLTGVTEQMIKDMPKFLSAGDAYQEYWNRSKEAVTRLSGGTGTLAAPATRP